MKSTSDSKFGGSEIPERSIPRMAAKAKEYVQEVLDYGMHNASSCGINARLEREFAQRFDARYAILHCNGTATMHSALLAADVGVGDEVIVPTQTMASTALVALYVNAVPVFADSDPDTYTIDPEDIRRKITPRTKAIITVSLYGLAPDMDAIMDIAREHNLVVIEDNAQCFLGYYKGKVVGSIGDMASFSFQGSKHMTSGDGGVVITNDEDLAMKVRRACSIGYSAVSPEPGKASIPQELRCHPSFARHVSYGYNFRMPEIAAAVALGELERLDELVEMRNICARLFDDVVQGCDWLIAPKVPDGYVHSWWAYTVRMTENAPDFAEFRKVFVELGGDGFYGCWLPVHREPFFQEFGRTVAANPERWPQFAGRMPDYSEVSCPVFEQMQPRLIQLKTNSFDTDTARRQADILSKAIDVLS